MNIFQFAFQQLDEGLSAAKGNYKRIVKIHETGGIKITIFI